MPKRRNNYLEARCRRKAFDKFTIVICHWCNYPLDPEDATADHLMPLCKGGIHSEENIVMSCIRCNLIRNSLYQLSKPNTKSRLCDKQTIEVAAWLKAHGKRDPSISDWSRKKIMRKLRARWANISTEPFPIE